MRALNGLGRWRGRCRSWWTGGWPFVWTPMAPATCRASTPSPPIKLCNGALTTLGPKNSGPRILVGLDSCLGHLVEAWQWGRRPQLPERAPHVTKGPGGGGLRVILFFFRGVGAVTAFDPQVQRAAAAPLADGQCNFLGPEACGTPPSAGEVISHPQGVVPVPHGVISQPPEVDRR